MQVYLTDSRHETMNRISDRFGKIAECTSIECVLLNLSGIPGSDVFALKQTVCYGMFVKVFQQAQMHSIYREVEILFEELVALKAEFDATRPGNRTVMAVTHRIIEAVRVFLEENTIPCLEWPTTQELAELIFQETYRIIHS